MAHDPTNPFQDRGELQRELGKFCPACQAIPSGGYCHLAGCPTAPAREYFAEASHIVCASESGGVTIATALSPEMARLIARALTAYGEPPLNTVVAWYRGLPKGAREKLSLANLHALAKQLGGKP